LTLLHHITTGHQKEKKTKKKKEGEKKETGAPVLERLVDRNYYFF
jgi:hypothetical protein